MLSVPLSWNDRVVGVINVQTRASRHFTPAETEFLVTISALLGGIAEGLLAHRWFLAAPTSPAKRLLARVTRPEGIPRSLPRFPGMLSEPPGADPHAGWCGRGQGKPGLYPILRRAERSDALGLSDPSGALAPVGQECSFGLTRSSARTAPYRDQTGSLRSIAQIRPHERGRHIRHQCWRRSTRPHPTISGWTCPLSIASSSERLTHRGSSIRCRHFGSCP